MKKVYLNRLIRSFNIILLLVICLIHYDTFSQSPGGVYTGLNFWLNANVGFTNGTPATWTNQVTTGTPTLVNGSPVLNTTSSLYNYNYYIDFAGLVGVYTPNSEDPNRQFVKLQGMDNVTGINYSSLFWALNLIDSSRVSTHLGTCEGVTYGAPPCLHGGGTTQAQLDVGTYVPADFGTTSALGTWQINGTAVPYNTNHRSTKNLISAIASAGGTCTLNRFLGGQEDQSASGAFWGSYRDWKGPVAELIGYTTALTAQDRQKIHSYLAVKYGITLPVDYLATPGSVIYPTTTSGLFINNIIGIGREDMEILTQLQSHYDSDTVRLYVSSLAAMNASNTGSFVNDISYIIMGDDKGQLNQTIASAANIPSGICTRIEREWEVVRTNCSENFNIDVHPSSLVNPLFLNPASLRLLVNTVPDMSTATVYTPTFSVNGGYITATGITTSMIPDNSKRYIAIAVVGDIVVDAGPDIPICPGDSAIILATATGSGTLTYSWSPATGLNNTTILQPTANPPTSTQYILNVTNGVCSKTDSMKVTIGGTITTVAISASTNPVCVGNSTTLTAIGANTYVWANGLGTSSSITVSPTVTTSYVVTGDVSGCTGNDTIKITVVPLPVFSIGNDTTICTGTFLDLQPPSPGYTYLWQDNSTNATYSVSQPGTFWVQITDNNNCISSDTITVKTLAPPNFILPTDASLCEGIILNLDIPQGPYNVLWSNNDTSFTNSFNVAGTYGVTASNKCGVLSGTFKLVYNDCNCYLYYPNAFSPNNGDGLNDYFGPKYQCNFYTYHLYIYNRWGQVVFETEKPDELWDGKCKNEDVDMGVYVWRVFYTAQYVIGPQSKNGTVTIIR